MLQDVQAVVRHVLADQPRKQLLFIGKSIGTLPIVSGFGESMLPSEASAILLTPLLNQEGFAESLLACKQNMYLVTGTADHYYHSETIKQIRDKHANIELDIVPNADHSLEIPFDTTVSLETLQQVWHQPFYVGHASLGQFPLSERDQDVIGVFFPLCSMTGREISLIVALKAKRLFLYRKPLALYPVKSAMIR